MFDTPPSLLSQLGLSERQAAAALSEAPAIAVTAGAGSGKTRTLVGRYLWLIGAGYHVRSLVAITFTEKAAREMRNRIREEIGQWRKQALPEEQKVLWDRAASELDAARIGTIHGLCASLLRSHPAEAGVDPMFEVLEENTAILLQARAVEDTMSWAIDDPICGELFGPLSEKRLRETISKLLQRRLDAQPAFRAVGDDALQHWSDAVAVWIDAQLAGPDWWQSLHDLALVSARRPDDKLEMARQHVLADWAGVQSSRSDEDWGNVIAGLMVMRRSIKTNVGAKGNWNGDDLKVTKEAMRRLCQHYDERFKPLFGGGSGEPLCNWTYDGLAAKLIPGLQRLFRRGLALYEAMKADRQALDFDDLESKAATLLVEHPAVCARWQTEISAVLVDEFQDTNARQREIIYRIVGFSGQKMLDIGYQDSPAGEAISNTLYPTSNLFIVGDGKQSIYRFRGADVSVFRLVQEDIRQSGGQWVDLDTTYRAHRPLLETLNALLAPILGEEEDPQRLYHTPFAPLHAYRQEPKAHTQMPFLEFHLGLGNAEEGRAAAAGGLAERLHELHQQGSKWGDMALLFRASKSFSVYEDALEAVGIPYVTVAGRGFYDRPEVRDLLNALTAIADPTDDVAMAGLLRSPAFGLSDNALFQLRWCDESARQGSGFWQALDDDDALAVLAPTDAEQAIRARRIVRELHEQAGRTAVAVILKALLDRTHYQAALHHSSAGERIWRNVDKLLADAHRSHLVGIGDFLEYVRSLRDAATREGEAPTEAGNAVQLMTVHKAKGLEFPIVVIADAARSSPVFSQSLLLDTELGPLLRVQQKARDRTSPLTYQLARQKYAEMDEAESRRLLYVAATRAEEKLLISGHCKISTSKSDPGRPQLSGWLQWLGDVAGVSELRYPDPLVAPISESLTWQSESAGLWLYPFAVGASAPSEVGRGAPLRSPAPRPTSGLRSPISAPLPLEFDLVADLAEVNTTEEIDKKLEEEEADPPPRVWRVVPKTGRARPPSWVVGTLVHRALQRWRFPGESDFEDFLRPFALECGLTSEQEIKNAIKEAGKLLGRLQGAHFFSELNQSELFHEVPYSIEIDGEIDSGIIDLLARSASDAPWKIYDFKSDSLRSSDDLQKHITRKQYDQQVRRYAKALETLLGQRPDAFLVFLDVEKGVKLEPC